MLSMVTLFLNIFLNIFFRLTKSVEPTVMSGTSLSKVQTLFLAALHHGEHKEFKEHLEKNPMCQNFAGFLRYGMHLVTKNVRQVSDVAPTLTILLQYGAKWNRVDLLTPGTSTPYHGICRSTGDHHELLQLMTKELGHRFVDTVDDCKRTALMYAVQNANLKCVEILIAIRADANIFQNTCGSQYILIVTDMITDKVNPLIHSINLLHPNSHCPSSIMLDIFDVLVDSVTDVNQPCHRFQRTPIMYAAAVGNVRCVEKLIEKGATLNTADVAGRTVWTLAARAGSVDLLKCLIEDHGIDKNSTDKHGLSVLCWAVRSGNIEAVRYLLNLGVTITTYMPQERVETCEDCQIELSCHFINRTQLNADPYMEAIRKNMPEVVKLLEEHGCQLYKCDEALSYAVSYNSVDVVEYLLCNHKCSLNFQYSENYDWKPWHPHQTLLKAACQRISVKIIKLLLGHGADPNKKRSVDQCPSAINVAISGYHVEVIACLIRSGVNVNLRSKCPHIDSLMPFEAAVRRGNIYALEMLLVSGCSGGVHSLDNNHEVKVKTEIDPDLQKLIKKWNVHENNVLPLKQRCRMMILNHLCPQADKKITELPLPAQIIKYLGIPELDDIMEIFNSLEEIDRYLK